MQSLYMGTLLLGIGLAAGGPAALYPARQGDTPPATALALHHSSATPAEAVLGGASPAATVAAFHPLALAPNSREDRGFLRLGLGINPWQAQLGELHPSLLSGSRWTCRAPGLKAGSHVWLAQAVWGDDVSRPADFNAGTDAGYAVNALAGE